jgi:hypothetical protein
MMSYSFSKLISPELKEQLDKLKGSFTDEQLKVLEFLETSTIVETKNSDGTKTYSLSGKEEPERSRYNEILKEGYAGLTGDDNFLRKKSYFLEQQEKIRRIKESTATPYRKLSDLIAATAYDFRSNSPELCVVLSKLGKRFNKDNNKASSIVDTILFFAEKEAQMGVTRTVHQWYDTIMAIMVVADKMEPEGEEKLQLKTKVLSLENQVRELKEKLKEAKALDELRIKEIDKWHGSYEHAEAEASMWQSEYEGMKEALKKAEYEKQETIRLKQENAKQQETIGKLKFQLESDKNIVATAKKYLGTNPLTPDVILNRFANDEAYKKREKSLEDKIKELQNKLGDKSVLLSVLAEGIKEFAEEKNIEEAHTLFEHLCYILIEEKGWTDNVADLKKFFKKARKEMQKASLPSIDNHGQVNFLTGKDAQAPYNPKEDEME